VGIALASSTHAANAETKWADGDGAADTSDLPESIVLRITAALPAIEGLAHNPEMAANTSYVLATAVEIRTASGPEPPSSALPRARQLARTTKLSIANLHSDIATLYPRVTNHF